MRRCECPALAREVERVTFGRERHAEFLQAVDRRGGVLDHELDDGAVVQPRAGDHRVLDMAFERIARLEHRRDPALRPGGRAFVELSLGEHGDLEAIGQVERRGEARRARADDEDVAD